MATAKAPPTPPATETASAPVVTETGQATPTTAKFMPKVLAVLTLPLVKLREGTTVYVKVTAPMKQADQLKNAKPDKDGKMPTPPMLLNCINLETGEEIQIIPGTVLQDLLTDKYKFDGYVGKGFWIVVNEKKGGGSGKSGYNTYTVKEIAV